MKKKAALFIAVVAVAFCSFILLILALDVIVVACLVCSSFSSFVVSLTQSRLQRVFPEQSANCNSKIEHSKTHNS